LELVEDVEELTVDELETWPGGVSFGAGGSGDIFFYISVF
jgi:hypothetical protein